ncbi:MAG: formylglycine-generating enzyme family protein [Pseudomonadota bacterium]
MLLKKGLMLISTLMLVVALFILATCVKEDKQPSNTTDFPTHDVAVAPAPKKVSPDLPPLESQSPDLPPLESQSPAVAGQMFRDRLKDGSKGPEMVWIPAGRFQMGNIHGSGDADEQPVHPVSIEAFAMGRYEVTIAEYQKFAKATKSSERDNLPVVEVSWNQAKAYVEWLSEQTGKKYRLPTEAEWEYAARAGTTTQYWRGNAIGSNKANCWKSYCGDKFEETAPVGTYAPNSFGLYDIIGNVWEWTCSEYENKYSGKEQHCSDTKNDNLIVLRGGSWNSVAWRLRSTERHKGQPAERDKAIGFRIVRHP